MDQLLHLGLAAGVVFSLMAVGFALAEAIRLRIDRLWRLHEAPLYGRAVLVGISLGALGILLSIAGNGFGTPLSDLGGMAIWEPLAALVMAWGTCCVGWWTGLAVTRTIRQRGGLAACRRDILTSIAWVSALYLIVIMLVLAS